MNDPNCIVKAFENTHITIIKNNQRKKFLFRATDVAQVIGVTNIYRKIQNYIVPDERLTRKCETPGGPQDIIFLTSNGVYKLLYTTNTPIARQFVNWVADILDDIIFNNADELQAQLEFYRARVAKLEQENEQIKTQMTTTLQSEQSMKEKAFIQSFDKKSVIYLAYVAPDIIKFGTTDDIYSRVQDHKRTFETFKLVWVIECTLNRKLERAIKCDKTLDMYRTKLKIGNTTHCELIQVDVGFGFDELVKTIKKLKYEVENENTTEIKCKELELEKARLDIEKMKLELIQSIMPDNLKLHQFEKPCDINSVEKSFEATCNEDVCTNELLINENRVAKSQETGSNTTRKIPPLPTLPKRIENMQDFYKEWQNNWRKIYEAHKAYAGRLQWLEVFGKQKYTSQKHMWTKCSDWLLYMDSLSSENQNTFLSLLDGFAFANNIEHNALIKSVFYYLVRPEGKVPEYHVKLVASLKELISNTDFPPLPEIQLQKKKPHININKTS